MKKYTFLFLFTILASWQLIAQTRLTMSDAIMKERVLRPVGLSQLQWIPKTSDFSYVSNHQIVKASAAKPLTVDSIQVLTKLSAAFLAISPDTLKALPAFTWKDAKTISFSKGSAYYTWNLEKNELTKTTEHPDDAENIDLHSAGQKVAYTSGSSLWISDGGKRIEVVKSEREGVVYGKSVHRDEFGIHKGTFWSNDGSALAFYRMDESMVTQYPVYILDSMPAQARMIRYPYAGAASHHVTVGVYHQATGQTVYLQTGEPADQYLTNIAWTPDNKHILIAVLNRGQNHMWLRKYDVATGRLVATLFEETNDKWVEPEHPAEFVPNGKGQFLWQSERDGHNHFYLYDAEGKLLRQVTRGDFQITQWIGFDAKGKYGFFQAADSLGMDRLIYRTNLETGAMELLTRESGTHTALINSDGSLFIDDFNSLNVPRTIHIRQVAKPEKSTLILSAPNPLKAYAMGQTSLFTIKSEGGFTLNGRMITPPNYQASQKYPALVYVYNGPHAQLVTNSWLGAANLWMYRLADQGYVVYTVDGRGSENRGFAFESNIHRNAGKNEVADQLTGLKYLKSQPFIDTSRIAVYGWSYGGFMATSLMTRPEAKGAFKCGIAGGAVTDWKMYEIMYTERYMDTPQENNEGYALSSTFTHLPNLKAPLLMIHGSSDDVVLWQHTLRYVQECVRKGIQVDYFVYPEHLHNVRGKDRVHLFEKIEGYLKANL